MGFRVLLIAVSGKDPATIHEEYSVVPTDRYEEIAESPVCGAALPNGRYLLYINDHILPDRRVFAKLSRNATLAACYANETVMNSLASSWDNGIERWSVFHDAQQGITHLETTGDPPDELRAIQERLFASQADAEGTDYVFDIPVELFVASGGVRYDQDIERAGPRPWQVLVRMNARKWWSPFG
ncbi:MAG: hypothetical protein KJZ78_23175 [Bryobacteraceae bacterium]|nr:hypothetical protein [Bryobacteraceae bacterium]